MYFFVKLCTKCFGAVMKEGWTFWSNSGQHENKKIVSLPPPPRPPPTHTELTQAQNIRVGTVGDISEWRVHYTEHAPSNKQWCNNHVLFSHYLFATN